MNAPTHANTRTHSRMHRTRTQNTLFKSSPSPKQPKGMLKAIQRLQPSRNTRWNIDKLEDGAGSSLMRSVSMSILFFFFFPQHFVSFFIRKFHRMRVGKSAASLWRRSVPPVKVPLKCTDEVNENSCREPASVPFPTHTGTIVCCMCCICDNISCRKLAVIMSWCDAVRIPSLSISLGAQKKERKVLKLTINLIKTSEGKGTGARSAGKPLVSRTLVGPFIRRLTMTD